MTDQRIAKWTRWIDGPIRSNVLTMHLQRDAWREDAKILDDNGQLPDSYWWEFMRDTYAATQAVAVRRQADTHPDVSSLGKLLQEIRDDQQPRITRKFWLDLWSDPSDPHMAVIAEKGWNDQYAGTVGTHLDPAIPAADFDALTTAAANVKRYVDQHVAHSEKPPAVPAAVTLTLQEVPDVIDVIGDLFGKYYNVLTANFSARMVPVIQHDWKAIFREPWMRS